MKINWYNIKILRKKEGISSIMEKINKSGKYAKRKDIEPLIRRLFKRRKETKDTIKHIKYMVETFRSEFSKEQNIQMIRNCNMILNKIENMN